MGKRGRPVGGMDIRTMPPMSDAEMRAIRRQIMLDIFEEWMRGMAPPRCDHSLADLHRLIATKLENP